MQADLHVSNVGILGCSFLTDHKPIAVALDEMGDGPQWGKEVIQDLNTRFPGIMEHLLLGRQMLERKRLRPTLVTYLNFRLQVWAIGFDADGTPPVRLIPEGISLDPMGPVTF